MSGILATKRSPLSPHAPVIGMIPQPRFTCSFSCLSPAQSPAVIELNPFEQPSFTSFHVQQFFSGETFFLLSFRVTFFLLLPFYYKAGEESFHLLVR